jgi:hypothetical protein
VVVLSDVVVLFEVVELSDVVVLFEVVEVAERACRALPQAGRATADSAASAPSATAVVLAVSLLRREGGGTGSNFHP